MPNTTTLSLDGNTFVLIPARAPFPANAVRACALLGRDAHTVARAMAGGTLGFPVTGGQCPFRVDHSRRPTLVQIAA